MPKKKIAGLVFLLCALCSYSISQQPTPGSFQGLVVQAGTNAPLGNATIELRAPSGGPVLDSITTADDGIFSFANVRPGQYLVSAVRAGYIKAEYGQRQPGGPSLILTVAAGQRANDVRLVMTPGGVISGRVTEKGKPVGIADVFAIRVAYYEGQLFPSPVLSAKTNDLGEYRIFWLPPGRYYVATMINDQASNSPVYLNPDGDSGSLFSTRFPMRAVLNRAIGAGAAENEMHVPTFYPGTVNPDVATQIDLRPGAEARNVDIASPALPIKHVRGNVIGAVGANPGGQPIRPQVRLVPLNLATALSGFAVGLPQGTADANGIFDIARVFPGSYAVVATSGALTATVPIEVRDGDTNGVVVNLAAGGSLSGRITVERSAPMTPDPVLSGLRVNLSAQPAMPNGQSYGAAPTPNGLFRVPANAAAAGILAGNYRVEVPPVLQPRSEPGVPPRQLPAPLQTAYVKSIRLGDRDVLNEGLPIQGSILDPLEIVIGTNPGSFEGRVLNDSKQPAGAVWVALIPENKLRYRMDHKFASTEADGRFRIPNVPPGDYKVFALEDVEKLAWQEPDLMRPYESRGTLVRIEEGKAAAIELTSIPRTN